MNGYPKETVSQRKSHLQNEIYQLQSWTMEKVVSHDLETFQVLACILIVNISSIIGNLVPTSLTGNSALPVARLAGMWKYQPLQGSMKVIARDSSRTIDHQGVAGPFMLSCRMMSPSQ